MIGSSQLYFSAILFNTYKIVTIIVVAPAAVLEFFTNCEINKPNPNTGEIQIPIAKKVMIAPDVFASPELCSAKAVAKPRPNEITICEVK